MRKARCSTFAVLVFATIASWLAAADPAAEKPSEKAKPKITLGKETTYITKPLRPDGYPDYVAVLNKRMSEGVTPANNAAVLYVKAFGLKEIPEKSRADYFQKLQIEPLPEKGEYYLTWGEMVRRWRSENPNDKTPDDDLFSQFDRAADAPWSAAKYPIVAEWLRLNDSPLRLIVEAGQRPKCYFPMAIGDSPLIACILWEAQQSRDVARALTARAMLRIDQGQVNDAWDDLLACHRLATHIANGYMLIETLVGIAIDGLARESDVALAHFSKCTTEQLSKMRKEFAALPPMPDMGKVIADKERLIFLDAVLSAAREPKTLAALTGMMQPAPFAAGELDEKLIDWNVVLRMGNEWYDRYEIAGQVSDRRERRRIVANIGDELKQLDNSKPGRPKSTGAADEKTSPKQLLNNKVGNALVSLLIPAFTAAVNGGDRCELQHKMVDVAFALASYRSDHNAYPEKLSDLVPNYLAKVPDDTFKAHPGPIGYRREGEAFVLWTVHINGIDELGASSDDNPAGDDIVHRPVLRERK